MGRIQVNLKGAQRPQQPSMAEQAEPAEYGYGSRSGYDQQQRKQQQRPGYGMGYAPSPYQEYYEPTSAFPTQYQRPRQQQPQQRQSPYAQSASASASADPFQQFFPPQRRSSHPQSSTRSMPSVSASSSRQDQPMPSQRAYPSANSQSNQSAEEMGHEEAASSPSSSSRNEGALLGSSGKQYSMASTQTFTKLDTIKAKYNDLVSRVNNIETSTNKEEMESLHRSKNLLAQISGDIDRLQFTGLDAIDTSLLHTGKDEARTKRKKLNHDIEELQQHVQELHRIYGDIGEQMTQHEEETQRKNDAAAVVTSNEDSDNYEDASEGVSAPAPVDSSSVTEPHQNESLPEEEAPSPTFLETEGNSLPPNESNENEIKRTVEEEEQEEEGERTRRDEEPTATETNEAEKETSASPEEVATTMEEQVPQVDNETVAEAQQHASQDVMDSIDMTDWVLEDSSPSAPSRDDLTTLQRLLREKEDLISEMQRQLLEKDKIIRELQSLREDSRHE